MNDQGIKMSVGAGAANLPQDVGIVQHLLNLAGSRRGMLSQPLLVDGLAGPNTLKAIQEFQKRFCKVAGDKIEPSGEAIYRLTQMAGAIPVLNDGLNYLDPGSASTRLA